MIVSEHKYGNITARIMSDSYENKTPEELRAIYEHACRVAMRIEHEEAIRRMEEENETIH